VFEWVKNKIKNNNNNNSNTGQSRTNKKLQEIYFEVARHRWAMQKLWKRIGDNLTHYWGMWATSSYRVCKEMWWTGKNYPPENGRSSRSPYYKYTPAIVLGNENFRLYRKRSILTEKIITFNGPDITFMNKKTKSTFLIDIAVPNTHNLAKTITDKQKKVPRNVEWNVCYVEAKGSTSDPDSNIIYGSNSKVTITKSNNT